MSTGTTFWTDLDEVVVAVVDEVPLVAEGRGRGRLRHEVQQVDLPRGREPARVGRRGRVAEQVVGDLGHEFEAAARRAAGRRAVVQVQVADDVLGRHDGLLQVAAVRVRREVEGAHVPLEARALVRRRDLQDRLAVLVVGEVLLDRLAGAEEGARGRVQDERHGAAHGVEVAAAVGVAVAVVVPEDARVRRVVVGPAGRAAEAARERAGERDRAPEGRRVGGEAVRDVLVVVVEEGRVGVALVGVNVS
ncbi:MAG: hypothetical protein M9894_00250 [Planctomycetes bacterium]|nr:hypothetical protein [Planctomycetota bacterium]